MEPEVLFRVIIVGDTGVGKSCMLLRFTEDRFKEQHNVTIGVEFGSRAIKVDGQNIKLQIWDTAGQESFRSITRSFYRKADGVILMYDITARHTFENCSDWLDEIKQNSSLDIVVYLVGNQIDLDADAGESREVTTEEGSAFFQQNRLNGFKETSAKSGLNVEGVFEELTRILYKKWRDRKDIDVDAGVMINPYKPKPKKKCCYIKHLFLNVTSY
jgi:Ras-related protein Rab-2A